MEIFIGVVITVGIVGFFAFTMYKKNKAKADALAEKVKSRFVK